MADPRPNASPPPLVLIANDQEWSTRSLESVLGPQGFASVRAYTGRQALELARRVHPDVIILDSGMPDISGIEICQRLREDLEFPRSTPIDHHDGGPGLARAADRGAAGRGMGVPQPAHRRGVAPPQARSLRSGAARDRSLARGEPPRLLDGTIQREGTRPSRARNRRGRHPASLTTRLRRDQPGHGLPISSPPRSWTRASPST